MIVDIHAHDVDRVFHYEVPEPLRPRVRLGSRVIVPFGSRKGVEGYVVGLVADSQHANLKPIANLLDDRPYLSPAAILVARWMSKHYLCTLSQAIGCFLPPGSRRRSKRTASPQSVVAYRVAGLREAEAALQSLETRAPKQAVALRAVMSAPTPLTYAQVHEMTGVSRAALGGLVAKGLVIETRTAVDRTPIARDRGPTREPYALNPSQRDALTAILHSADDQPASVHLLQGVTGSGKTEVYLQAIQETIRKNKGAILLVPEISLTDQTVRQFQDLFGSALAVLHSRLSLGERFDQWHAIHQGRVRIVVGARSAVFAPVQNLGLIVLDEEHETSYKQDETPRYHAREVAEARATAEGAALILGSATPALETRYRSGVGDIRRIILPQRVDGRPLPRTVLVDMREELAAGNRSVFSRALYDALVDVKARGEQAVLFINRRGFASFLLCRECGYVPGCDRCEVSLTFHQPGTLKCHYCDAERPAPAACPTCGGRYLRPFGGGTQRVEHELHGLLPELRSVRMDVDTTRRKGAHQRILGDFGRGEYDVLIGTQMIAKGLHFPEVTLVGVVSADTGLHFPDFRAAERTFQLLTQVAGRAGRGRNEGKVIIQTYAPDHYAIRAALSHDYEGFYHYELEFRRRAGYPPFARLARCVWSGESEESVIDLAVASSRALEQLDGALCPRTVGPSPAPLSRLKGRFRWHLILKGTADMIQAGARVVREAASKRRDVHLAIDVNPVGML